MQQIITLSWTSTMHLNIDKPSPLYQPRKYHKQSKYLTIHKDHVRTIKKTYHLFQRAQNIERQQKKKKSITNFTIPVLISSTCPESYITKERKYL